MRDPNGNSSDDLALARRLSQQLAGSLAAQPAAAKPGLAAPAAAEAYARFGVAPRKASAVEIGSAGWNTLLNECMALSGASAAFAIDVSGLLIATSGRMNLDEVEAMASRLAVAIEQIDRMTDHAARAVTIDLGDRLVTAFRYRGGDQPVTLALLTRAPLPDATRQALLGMLVP